MVVDKHGIHTFKVVVVVLLLLLLSFQNFVPTNPRPLLIFEQVEYPNMLKCQLLGLM